MFKIATWNVNSLRVRLPHVLQWLAEVQPDVLALQETKVIDEDFPFAEINQAGYECVFSGQRTYNGMAILSKKKCLDAVTSFPEYNDVQRRVLAVTIDDVRILNLYIPNGESVASEKYTYKLNWLDHLQRFVQNEIKNHAKVIILGDFNIAPHDRDVHDPKLWEGKVLVSEPERALFNQMLGHGFADCFRLHEQPEKSYSWWDYRLNAFKRNMGMRIDHILATDIFAKSCARCYIDKTPRAWDRPSDHTPVVAEFGLV
jgi:exodeoxyribonuclease-3